MSDLYERAAIIPGRSMTRSKAPDRLLRAWTTDGNYGAEIWDTEGRKYIDTLCALGAVSLGYQNASELGDTRAMGVCSLPYEEEVIAAEEVLVHVAPWASSVRFFKTGSEATHAAYRIAKKATGRRYICKGDWAYHGWHEWCDEAVVYQHGASLEEVFVNPLDIAAVFVEPHRWEPVSLEWLRSVRAFCDRVGALLVFDEMIYGGRWSLGGATQYFGVTPDLATYGKAFGNGQAVAFVVGNGALADHGEIASGTYSGDATGLSAVLDTLDVYTKQPVIDTLWTRGRQLQEGLRLVIPAELGVVEGEPVHQRIRFHEPTAAVQQPYDYRIVDRPRTFAFRDAMAKRGVLMLPDAINVMYAHTKQQIDRVIQAAAESVKELA